MAISRKTKDKTIQLEINTNSLTPAQVRLIKSFNAMLIHVINTQEEGEFFDGSAELMRMCAALIKQSKFTELLKEQNNIPYADQVLEYSVDVLQEHMSMSKVVTYDN